MVGGAKIVSDSLRELITRAQGRSEKEFSYLLIHQNRYRFLLKKIFDLGLPRGSKILDIGCYPPYILQILEEWGFEVYGISSRHEPIKGRNISVLNIETDPLPFPKASFDLVLLTEIIEHLLVDPEVYLKKIKQVLKPGGKLLVTTPNVVHLKNRLKILLGKNIYYSLEQLQQTKTLGPLIYHRHNREFTEGELRRVFIQSGFKISSAQHFNSYSPFRKKMTREPLLIKSVKITGFLLTYLYPPFKDSIYLLLHK